MATAETHPEPIMFIGGRQTDNVLGGITRMWNLKHNNMGETRAKRVGG